MKRFIFFLILLVCGLFPAATQSTLLAGGDDIADLRSPVFIGTGSHVTSLEAPQAGTLNPASGALNQRLTLDLSYIGLISSNAEEKGWVGHGINLGGTLPTKYGVLSGSMNFLTESALSLQTGTFAMVDFSFAKDLYPDLLAGIGVNFTGGAAGEGFDWGLSADIGILQFAGNYRFMKNLRWAFVLQDLGKPYAPIEGKTGSPSPFTPVFGAAFTAFSTKDLTLEVQTDMSLPSFQNFRLGIGSSLAFRDFVRLDTGLRFDVRQLFSENAPKRSLIPSVGLSFNLKTDLKEKTGFIAENGWNQSEVRPSVSLSPFMDDLWAFGMGVNIPLGVLDKNPPELSVEYADGASISPNNDGKADDLVLPIKIRDQRFIQSWSLKIMNQSGTVIREIRNKDERPENAGFRSVLKRIVSPKQGITVPETLRWDGNTDAGSAAPDGSYTFIVESIDDNGNTAVSPPHSIVIDTTAPAVTLKKVKADELIFSPNGDGNKDTVKISQTGSNEELWSAEILDAHGTIVRSFSWEKAEPAEILWDGKTDAGLPVGDGVYSYVIRSTDKARNSGSGTVENIIVNTEQTPIQVMIDNSWFSPNRDNTLDVINFRFDIPVRSGIDTWELTIRDEAGAIHRTFTDTGEPPLKVAFDGQGNRGNILPEGRYTGTLKVHYRNGNTPVESSPQFTLDITPPMVSINFDNEVFSPNGDGNKDTVTVFQETSREDLWQGAITDVRGNPAKTFSWYGNADSSIVWDGRSDKGLLLPDGLYEYSIRSVDKAGNTGTSRKAIFRLNTEETPVILSADLESFSPNGDGTNDRIRIVPQLRVADGVSTYEVRILDASGKTVKTFSGRNRIESAFTWDGISNDSRRSPDGQYRAEISIAYENGNRPQARSGTFNLDTEFPKAAITPERTLFSPDGDGKMDTVTFRHTASQEEVWEGKIVSAAGATVRNYFWKGTVPVLTWDGKDEAGNIVDDGIYRYTLSSKDRAGNAFATAVDQITVDTRAARVFVTVDAIGFSPNGDKFADEVQFTPYISLRDGIESWSLQLVRNEGSVVHQFGGTTSIPALIKWDGKGASGSMVDGSYKGVFTVKYLKGNEPVAETTSFILDTKAPETRPVLNPQPFSPDNDGIDDELRIALNVQDTSDIRDWSIRILDPTGKTFREFTGKGKPGDIIWDGRALNGELVQAAEDYPYVLTVTDVLGNVATSKGIIPVDVLVIRDGDKLKIRISSINFAANSPGLSVDDKVQKEKNIRVLKRLAEILNKYSRYKIRIEGHAVRVFWNDPVKGAKEEQTELIPLSLARAETVKAELMRLGVDPLRISSAGLGGSEPVVPHDDAENRWKNRRVEFILIR